jgi:hypothetical protein
MSRSLIRTLVIALVDRARAGDLGHKLPWYLALRGRGGRA